MSIKERLNEFGEKQGNIFKGEKGGLLVDFRTFLRKTSISPLLQQLSQFISL
jgi:hypothetical protein